MYRQMLSVCVREMQSRKLIAQIYIRRLYFFDCTANVESIVVRSQIAEMSSPTVNVDLQIHNLLHANLDKKQFYRGCNSCLFILWTIILYVNGNWIVVADFCWCVGCFGTPPKNNKMKNNNKYINTSSKHNNTCIQWGACENCQYIPALTRHE